MRYQVMYGVLNEVPMADDGAHGDGAAGDGFMGRLFLRSVQRRERW